MRLRGDFISGDDLGPLICPLELIMYPIIEGSEQNYLGGLGVDHVHGLINHSTEINHVFY